MLKLIRFYKNYQHKKHPVINIICLITLFWAIAYSSFEYFIPLFLDNLNQNFIVIGLILSIPSIIAVLLDTSIGYSQIKFKRKHLLIFSLLIFILISLILNFSGNLVISIMIAMFLYGLAFDLFDITSYSTVFIHSSKKTSSSNLSLKEMFEAIGIIIGGVIIGLVFSKSPSGATFVFGISSFLGLLLVLRFYKEKQSAIKKSDKKHTIFQLLKNFKSLLKGKTLYLLILAMAITLWDGLFFGFESLFATKFHNPYINENIFAGILMALYVSPILFLEHIFGFFEDKIGKKNFIIIGLLIASLGIFLISLSSNIFLLSLSVMISSFGIFSVAWPAVSGLFEDKSTQMIGRGESGEAVGLLEIFENIGYIIGPILGGILINSLDFGLTFKTLAGLMLVLSIVSFIVLKKES